MHEHEPSFDDRRWLEHAVELSRRCPPSATFRVGSVIVGRDGEILAEGYSHDVDTVCHAEESALQRAQGDPRLAAATIYSTLEPCSKRASRPRTCTQLIIDAGIPRVVFAMREPSIFVDCEGAELLRAAGLTVVEMPELSEQVRAVNSHLIDS
ncbi:MAG TPA: deaminase [Candidatus Dormibacteraeota bacterium]|jgi:diaminohydroxyphosphoribosylaminopyrimidine deaminase/5-amino-6-(5-phosphoribosylamino)uracil reductase|nr:deaminase [Candidatus Dormibacteraeota bacterium]